MGSTGRPRWQRFTPPAAALAIAVTAVPLTILGAGASVLGATGSFLDLGGVIAPVLNVLILIGSALLGFAAGRAWPVPMLPPAMAVLFLVAQLFLLAIADHSRLHSLAPNLTLPAFPWETFTTATLLGRLVLGAGVILGGLLLALGASWPSRVAGVAALLAGLTLSVYIMPPGHTNQLRVDAAAQRLVCADGTPQVCVTAVHEYELAVVTPAARAALTLLAKLPGAPTRAIEWRADAVSTSDPEQYLGATPKAEPGTVLFRIDRRSPSTSLGDMFDWGPTPSASLTAHMVNGAGTTMNGCRRGDPVALGAAGAWLMGVDVLPLDDRDFLYSEADRAEITATVRTLRAVGEREQLRRVTALRDAANSCRTDNLRGILTGGPAA
jgi:hypothetical protein